jgi:putative DeoR family transcriptional regulator (stage III sporulation protein D)
MEKTYDRVISEAKFILVNKSTVRETAKAFGVSKSTVHKDLTEKLYQLDKQLFSSVRKLLTDNLNERHLRGGQATKLKFKRKKFFALMKERISAYNKPNN